METLAFLHAHVAHEDPRERPKLRSLTDLLSLAVYKPAIALKIVGYIVAVSMLTNLRTHAAVAPETTCSTVQVGQQSRIQNPVPNSADEFSSQPKYAILQFFQRYGLAPYSLFNTATAIAFGTRANEDCDSMAHDRVNTYTSNTPIAIADVQQPKSKPERQSGLNYLGIDAASGEPTIIRSIAAKQQEQVQATRLVLKRSERRVYAYQDEQELASFPVAVGKPGWETPVGTFHVRTMVKNPGWTHPFTGEVMSPESNNPLGERWIEFWTDGFNSIGFHGTSNRSSVGQAASHGCVRMYNEDIQKLYEWVSKGTLVIVEQ
ncbi:MAG: L,D-transpeptidase [Thainema sp.]